MMSTDLLKKGSVKDKINFFEKKIKEKDVVHDSSPVEISKSKYDYKKGLREANSGNGQDMKNYFWVQSLQKVIVNIPLAVNIPSSFAITRKYIACEIKKDHLKIGFKGLPPILEGDLYKSVEVDDCFWRLENQCAISVHLTKQDQMEWWKFLVKGEPEIDTTKLVDLDPEKIMSDQQLNQMRKPTGVADSIPSLEKQSFISSGKFLDEDEPEIETQKDASKELTKLCDLDPYTRSRIEEILMREPDPRVRVRLTDDGFWISEDQDTFHQSGTVETFGTLNLLAEGFIDN